MNEQTEARLKHLIDPKSYATDVWYHAQVSTFRSWLLAAEMAMRDEDVSNRTIERVLNRMVFATPTPVMGPDNVMVKREDLENLIMSQDPRRHIRVDMSGFPSMGGTTRPSESTGGAYPRQPAPKRPGHRDVADLYTDKGQHGPHPA